jgi:hypothetical protein
MISNREDSIPPELNPFLWQVFAFGLSHRTEPKFMAYGLLTKYFRETPSTSAIKPLDRQIRRNAEK